ncbi:MAG TPA: adenylate/guanylate cyclase domain-containing protein [Lacipirellulaceae bacterium]|nr:adenylate/guanylate cyclase domain-containing protein [Lacipirellulaceae bacterium]
MKSFFALIDRLIAAPLASRPEIERFIWESFSRRLAVLALDMSSFSMAVRRNGVLPHLCQIRRMQVLTEPLINQHGGQLLKYEADNLLAVFEDCASSVAAALAINYAFIHRDDAPEYDPPIAVSIGIDFGEMLLLPGEDCFGDPVNVAHKLGEDIARPGEVLVTQRVRRELGDGSPFELAPVTLSIAGVDVEAFRVLGG